MSTETRFFASAAVIQSAPGFHELRITIKRRGEADHFATITARPTRDTPDVLAAFGWRPVGRLEYVAGPNEERGEVEECEPAEGSAAEALREAVRREIRARSIARVAHPDAAHFQPVMLGSDHSQDPIGWTFRVGRGDESAFMWVTARGRVAWASGNTQRAEMTRLVRHLHMMNQDRCDEDEPALADLMEQPGRELARLLHLVRNGGTLEQPPRCVHHQYATEAVTGDPVSACARKSSGDRFGVFTDEGCVETFDCAVQAANAALVLDADAGEGLHRWEALCSEHEEQPASTCEECAADAAEEEPAEEEPAEDEAAPFEEGDRVVCADGVARTVKGIAPRITGEPVRVILDDGWEWIAENCRRANPADVLEAGRRQAKAAERVRTNPNPSDPEWRAALAELDDTLTFLAAVDPAVRAGIAQADAEEAARAVHPKACGFQPLTADGAEWPIAWTFRVYVGDGMTRYGVVTAEGEIAPIGLHEYVTTAERAFRQHIAKVPAQYRDVPVPAEIAQQWTADPGAAWRAGVDAALSSVALGG